MRRYFTEPVHLKHKPYQLNDKERKMLFKLVDTPDGTGTLIDIFEKTVEVQLEDRKEYFPKDHVSLSPIQLNRSYREPTSNYEKIMHEADLREATNTPAKKKYIFGGGSLNEYRTHEKQVYGTINA